MDAAARRRTRVIASYDAIAKPYAERFFDELDGKPWDRAWLDRFAEAVAGRGRVCDLGCGPGQIARYLAARGVDAIGIDASASMIGTARALNPTLTFARGDFLALTLPGRPLSDIAAAVLALRMRRPVAPAPLIIFGSPAAVDAQV